MNLSQFSITVAFMLAAALPAAAQSESVPNKTDPPKKTAASYADFAIRHLFEKDKSVALTAISKAIELDPTSADFRSTRSIIYSRQDRYAEALQDLNTALQMEDSSPGRPTLLENRANIYVKMGDIKAAENDVREIQATGIDNFGVHVILSGIHKARHHKRAAIKELEIARYKYDHRKGCIPPPPPFETGATTSNWFDDQIKALKAGR